MKCDQIGCDLLRPCVSLQSKPHLPNDEIRFLDSQGPTPTVGIGRAFKPWRVEVECRSNWLNWGEIWFDVLSS